MKILFNPSTGEILDASNVGAWQVPDFAQVEELDGDAEAYAWPNGLPQRCLLQGKKIAANPVFSGAPVPPATIDDVVAVLTDTQKTALDQKLHQRAEEAL